jgi:hypothetical protein
MVDPADYIAAPIDLRYDRRNNVWTAPRGFWAEVLASGSNGAYSWKEKMVGPSGTLIDPPSGASWYRQGTTTKNSIYEVNKRSVPSGTKVWVQIPERSDNLQFEFGGGGGLDVQTSNSGYLRNVEYLTVSSGTNTNQILRYVAGPSGENSKIGAALEFWPGPGSYAVLSTINGKIVWDYPRMNNGVG